MGTVVVPGRLFLGSFAESFDRDFLAEHGVTHVLNVASELDVVERVGRRYLKLGVNDDDAGDDVSRVLDAALAFATEAGARVMVHCLEGVSRSVVVAACCAAAMRSSTFDAELEGIRQARPAADPFPEFVAQARRWDRARAAAA